MFEKFTEKALEVVTIAKDEAIRLGHEKVYPEHILIGLYSQKTSLISKLFDFAGIKKESLEEQIKVLYPVKKKKNIVFSEEIKNFFKLVFDIAKISNSQFILTEHLFLALLKDKKSKASVLLKNLNFDIEKSVNVIKNFSDKKSKGDEEHPEGPATKDIDDKYDKILSIFKESTEIFDSAVAKLSTSQYEILGTEQIVQSILESNNENLKNILNKFGITQDSFAEKLAQNNSRQEEFEKKQIIFTPNAFKTMLFAIETATELGSVKLNGEHIILGLLKSQSGLAYKVFKDLNVKGEDLKEQIIKPIEKQMPETLVILRLAKQEARRIGKNVVGSEMILLGIIAEATGVGARVLNELGVNLKEARKEVEKLIGFGDEYESTKLVFSARAKKIIDMAWTNAKKENKPKINSEHLLYAMTKQQNCVAMKVLMNLGVDIVEIKQGIKTEIEK